MYKVIFYLLILTTLSGCSFNLDNVKSTEIDLVYALDKSTIDNLQLDKLAYIPYQKERIEFTKKHNLAIFKFKLKENKILNNEAVVVIEHKYFYKVSYFSQYSDGSFSKQEDMFRQKPTENRVFRSEKFVFNYNNDKSINHFIKVVSYAKSKIGIKLVDKDSYIKVDNDIAVFFTILYSSLFMLFLMNFVYYIYIRHPVNLYYSIYVLSALYAIYWQESRLVDFPIFYYPILGYGTKTFFFILSNIMAIVFAYKFLKLDWKKQLSGKLLIFWAVQLIFLLYLNVHFYLFDINSEFVRNWYNFTAEIGNLLILTIAFISYKNGNKGAIFLVFARLVIIIFSSFRIKFILNPGPYQFWSQHSYEIGLLVEAIIFIIGLAWQTKRFKKSRDSAQIKFSEANKALFAETLINNFLYEIKDKILNENKVKDFINLIEEKFSIMVMKYAPIENIAKINFKSEVCYTSILSHKTQESHISTFIDENKQLLKQSCEDKTSFSHINNIINSTNKIPLAVQFIIIPVPLNYSNSINNSEVLILETAPNNILSETDVNNLNKFIDKSIKALMDSQQLQQITKHAQNIISEAEEKDKSMRTKDRFFANISHEFRTPLTLTIAPLKDLDSQKEFLNTSGKYLVETALSNAQSLMELVNNILDTQKLESENFPLKISKVNLNKIIYSVIKQLINWSLDHYQSLSFNKQDKDDVYLYCDKKEIRKTVVNIVSNAIKYSGSDSKIIISIEQDSTWIKINIKDDGVGISEDEQKHVFERYYQGSSINHLSEAGTGIGLSYVKDIMSLHRGKVELQSNEGYGSKFTLWFKSGYSHYDYDEIISSEDKLKLQNNTNLQIKEKQTQELENNISNDDITTILIVEDNKELLKFLNFKFKNYYKILKAKNGLVGLEKAKKGLPDLIISDVMMPTMDGIEMTQQLRKSKELKTIPIILLTAKSTNNDTVEGLEIGADDYVTKPFDFDELKARVDRLITSKKAIREELNYKKILPDNKTKTAFQAKLDDAILEKISNNNLNVEVLADILYIDRSSLYRKIKMELEMTPIAYIRKVRMDYAVNLLKNKKLTVSETAYACGFHSLSYFSKQFKKTHGTSPSDIS